MPPALAAVPDHVRDAMEEPAVDGHGGHPGAHEDRFCCRHRSGGTTSTSTRRRRSARATTCSCAAVNLPVPLVGVDLLRRRVADAAGADAEQRRVRRGVAAVRRVAQRLAADDEKMACCAESAGAARRPATKWPGWLRDEPAQDARRRSHRYARSRRGGHRAGRRVTSGPLRGRLPDRSPRHGREHGRDVRRKAVQEELRTLCEDIIATRSSEIETMQTWLQEVMPCPSCRASRPRGVGVRHGGCWRAGSCCRGRCKGIARRGTSSRSAPAPERWPPSSSRRIPTSR